MSYRGGLFEDIFDKHHGMSVEEGFSEAYENQQAVDNFALERLSENPPKDEEPF